MNFLALLFSNAMLWMVCCFVCAVPPGGFEPLNPKDNEDIPTMLAAFKSKDRSKKLSALKALGSEGDKAKAESGEIAKSLEDDEYMVRIYAAISLRQVDSKSTVGLKVLISMLHVKDQTIQCTAALAFEGYGKDAIPFLLEVLKENDARTVVWAEAGFVSLGKVALPSLLEAAKDKNELLRKNALEAIKLMKIAEE